MRLAIPLVLALVLLGPGTVAASPDDATLPDSIRIRVLERQGPERVEITAPGHEITAVDRTTGAVIGRWSGDRAATVRLKRDELRIEWQEGTARARLIRLAAADAQPIRVLVGEETRTYHGSVDVSPDPAGKSVLLLVNRVDLERYVASVVTSEYGLDDFEGAKAMAVVARTYAVRSMNGADAPYDLADNDGDQVYNGSGSISQIARLAAEATAGEILTYDGRPIDAVYSSSSGGHTASNEDVWNGTPHPYLRGRSDPWDRVSPTHEWTWSVERDRLHAMAKSQFDVRPRSIEISETSPDGRATSIRLDTGDGRSVTVSAADFRSAVIRTFGGHAMRSTFFEVRRDGDSYRFDGRGYGHGVGLSQWGAHGMSEAGKSYQDILHFYYTDVALETWPSTTPDWTIAGSETEAFELPAAVAVAGHAARVEPPTERPRSAQSRGRIQAWGGSRADGPKNPVPTRRVGW